MDDARLPVTLLTGFLGAGKTTLLNAVLADATAGRIAVIVNEFGEAGLDHDLIESSTDEVVLMRSGCLCCSVLGDLAVTLAGLMDRRREGELSFDRVAIETTGLADPGPILRTLQSDPFLTRTVLLDGVATVVDSLHGPRTLDDQFEAVSQVAMADLIVMSKTDLVDASAVETFTDRLRSLNSTARILQAVRGEDASAAIFGISGTRRDLGVGEALSRLQAPIDPLANLSGLAAPRPTRVSPHDARIRSASTTIETPIAGVALDIWITTLMAFHGANILRIKGIVFLEEIEKPFVIHAVQDAVDKPVPLAGWSGEDRRSRIVVIARDIDQQEIERGFEALRMTPIERALPAI